MGDNMENTTKPTVGGCCVQQWEFLKYHPFYYIDETNDDTPLKQP